ncbi:MAG TPA: hypothetical protein VGF55_33635 [Gemmataceae bacterium]|jgi:5-methylcytosine-specific restriction endonuclease McrBC regulatory subunit McrC
MPPSVIRLTERVPRVVRLHRADVDHLLAHHRGHVEVTPTGSTGRHRLTALGVAGVLAIPHARLVIRPKLPAANLFQLLDPSHPPPADVSSAAPVDAGRLLDLLAGRFAALLAERVAAGLHRDYAERADAGAYLRGRLDAAEQARDAPARRDRLHSRYDEFTADAPCNRLPRAVAEALLARPDLNAGVRAAVRGTLGGFAGIAVAPLTPELCAAGAPDDRRAAGYGPLLDLCRLLAAGLAPGMAAGSAAGPTFLLDLEPVWERYVTAGVVAAFADRRGAVVRVQPFLPACPVASGQPDLHLRPDVLIDAGRPDVVLDAKWKRLARTALPTEDVYQVLAYAAALGAPRAVLVYPGGRTRRWAYPTAGPRLEVWTVRVSGPREACERSRRRLGRALRSQSR